MAFVVEYLPTVFRCLFGAFGLLGNSPLYLSCIAYFGILPVLEHNYCYSAGLSAVVFILFAGLAGYLQSRRQA